MHDDHLQRLGDRTVAGPHADAQGEDVSRPHTPRAFQTPVRGHAFASRPDGVASPREGQAARLVREPHNPADRYAVAIWAAEESGPWRVGYLDRSVAVWIAPCLDQGLVARGRFDGWVTEPDGRWRRPVIVVEPDTAPSGDATTRRGPGRGEALDDVLPELAAARPPGVRRRVVR